MNRFKTNAFLCCFQHCKAFSTKLCLDVSAGVTFNPLIDLLLYIGTFFLKVFIKSFDLICDKNTSMKVANTLSNVCVLFFIDSCVKEEIGEDLKEISSFF